MWKTICTRFRNQVEIDFIKTFILFYLQPCREFSKNLFNSKTPFAISIFQKLKNQSFSKRYFQEIFLQYSPNHIIFWLIKISQNISQNLGTS